MNTHPANSLFRALKAMASPIDLIEDAAVRADFHGVSPRAGLFILYRGTDHTGRVFSYQAGDAEVSRKEFARRLAGGA